MSVHEDLPYAFKSSMIYHYLDGEAASQSVLNLLLLESKMEFDLTQMIASRVILNKTLAFSKSQFFICKMAII